MNLDKLPVKKLNYYKVPLNMKCDYQYVIQDEEKCKKFALETEGYDWRNVNIKDSNRPEGCYYYEGNPDGKGSSKWVMMNTGNGKAKSGAGGDWQLCKKEMKVKTLQSVINEKISELELNYNNKFYKMLAGEKCRYHLNQSQCVSFGYGHGDNKFEWKDFRTIMLKLPNVSTRNANGDTDTLSISNTSDLVKKTGLPKYSGGNWNKLFEGSGGLWNIGSKLFYFKIHIN